MVELGAAGRYVLDLLRGWDFQDQERAKGGIMIRGFMRLFGLLLLAVGFIFLIYDGARSIADQTTRLTSLEQSWSDIHQSSLVALKPAIEHSPAPWLWVYAVAPVLQKPTWLVLGVLGLLLLLLFRPRRRLIGYARD